MIRTSSVLFWFGMTLIASLALYRTSDRVHELSQKLHEINTAIEAEQQTIHVLKAEWVYLANPARIEAIAQKHLSLRPSSPQQVAQLSTLAEILPTRSEAMAAVAISGTPIANIKSSLSSLRPRIIAAITKHKAPLAVASANTGRINDHMIMERTASAVPVKTSMNDSIGTLISDLNEPR